MALNALLVEINEEDEMWGRKQDRWACAIVRSIQRKHPEAVFVTADTNGVKLSIPEDGENGVRYSFQLPKEVVEKVIKNFDQGKPIDPEWKTFSLKCVETKPMQSRPRKGRSQKKRAQSRKRASTKSPVVHNTNRFKDDEASEV